VRFLFCVLSRRAKVSTVFPCTTLFCSFGAGWGKRDGTVEGECVLRGNPDRGGGSVVEDEVFAGRSAGFVGPAGGRYGAGACDGRSEEHTSELQSGENL